MRWKRTMTMWPGRVDRSPCGTGNSANLANLHARGKAKVGDIFKSRSIIGSQFEVGLSAVTEVAGKAAIIPAITGRGFTFGLSQVSLDPFDPLAKGFVLTDGWGHQLARSAAANDCNPEVAAPCSLGPDGVSFQSTNNMQTVY